MSYWSRGFQCHKLFQWSNNAVAAWNLPQVLWSLAVMSCAAIVPAGLSCVSFIIASSNAYGSLHLSDSIDFRGVFLISDSPFLCDKETFFFFFFFILLTRLCSIHSLEGNFTNSPSVLWQHNYHLTWQLFPWILNIQNTSKGTGGIQEYCCLWLRSVGRFWKGEGFLQSQGRHSTARRLQLSDEKGFGKYYQI